MRLLPLLTLAIVLVAPTLAHADSILVGTDLSNIQPGPEMCLLANLCNVPVSQFTLLTSVVVDDVKVAISGPIFSGTGSELSNGHFGVNLFSQLPVVNGPTFTSGNIGTGNLVFDPLTGPLITQVFDFGGLDIPLGPGTYYLQIEGGNLAWNSALPLATSAGTLGLQVICPLDSGPCPSDITNPVYGRYQGTFAMQVSGTEVTPEPSSWVLFGTGILGFAGVARRKFLAIS
jgi:PEP-CTERM motif